MIWGSYNNTERTFPMPHQPIGFPSLSTTTSCLKPKEIDNITTKACKKLKFKSKQQLKIDIIPNQNLDGRNLKWKNIEKATPKDYLLLGKTRSKFFFLENLHYLLYSKSRKCPLFLVLEGSFPGKSTSHPSNFTKVV